MELNSVYNAESPIVWRGEYHFPDDEIDSVKEKIISLTESKESQGVGKIYSTFFIPDIYKRPEVVLLDTYKEIVSQIAIEMNFSNSEFSLNYWCQIYDGSHGAHMHYSAEIIYSFVHFIRPTERECFYFSGQDGRKYYPKQDKGDIIVFPSITSHGIDESYGTERMTIAGNLVFSSVMAPDDKSWCKISEIRKGLYVSEYLYNDE